MKLVINQKDFRHISELSVYNNNIYKHRSMDIMIREICHEDEDWYEYKIIDKGIESFLGSSHEYFTESELLLNIDFKVYYT